ncbi:MAG: hypothetical protein E5V49_16420 [Mesorhizobium sp.]|nr:hypothetical protein EN848_22065 [bacterium M00.F.Ca.ET.205.01.1.1]TGU50946.1 hypothetical protein EN795_21610 [bacterium M00.F.Ca.ET.152.01.1.1]TGV34437.1 hypothetical protein EN829_019565 [Mesorhizobium sp. M00.F.Ca.ET.186.01.1.1]TGZ41895.1 hypothetical protein EN805_16485 [bacterium M00.F.Ca.ET.162.01.1.1]TJW31460.1 MAG: hypothetical protein E5V49_16420 [Mesorhizobium sp.]
MTSFLIHLAPWKGISGQDVNGCGRRNIPFVSGDFCLTSAGAGLAQKKKSPGDAGAYQKINQAFAFS